MAIIDPQNLRRLRTYRRRILGMAGSGLRHRCFFMHVPKCGGTSVAEALYATVPMHQRIGVIDADSTRRATALVEADRNELLLYYDDIQNGDRVYALREAILLAHMAWDTALIHGHVLFSHKADRHFGDRYRYVTILRDPLERTLSNYRSSVDHGLIPDDFAAYLESFVFRSHALTALRYFSGRHDIPLGGEAQALEEAKAVMARFAVVGFLHDLPGFCARFVDVFGKRPRVFRYNEARAPKPRASPAQLDRIREVLAPEFALWEHAQEHFGGS